MRHIILFNDYFTPYMKLGYSLSLGIILYTHFHYHCKLLKYFVCLMSNFKTKITLKV